MFQNVQQIQDFIRQNGIAFLDFKMIDLRGRWKHLSIPAARFNEDIMTHGIGFDGSNYGYAQVERSDMVFLPDITTAVVDPFVKAPTLTMIGDVMVIDHPGKPPVRPVSAQCRQERHRPHAGSRRRGRDDHRAGV